MDFLTDEELKAALEKYEDLRNIPINSSTRSVLIRKLAKITNGKIQGDTLAAADESEPLKISHNAVSHNDGSQFQLVSSDNVFYALSLCDTTYSRVKEMEKVKQIFKYKPDALQAIKHIPGARCIKCETEESARIFVDKQLQRMKESKTEAAPTAEPSTIVEKANGYPSLNTQLMNIFRVIIEKKDLDGFRCAICSNPYHLITAGDTPTILKPPLRYNALHCAVRTGSLEICEELLETVQGDEFWSKVYPKDPLEIRKRRRDHLLDLYLNTCDRGFYETPLHFACKYGHEEIIEYLLRFSGVLNVEARNKYGETAHVLTCTQDGNSSEAKKKRITDLLSGPAIYYVPVLRAPDNSVYPKLSTPCTYQELVARECEADHNLRMEATVLSSVAGPMSPLQAKAFYNEWRSPSQSVDRKEAKNMKRTDPDRGLERIGRRLAHRQKVMWAESWDFLNCSCDLSEEEGKKALEQYLARLHFPSRCGAKLEQHDDIESEVSPLMLDIHYQEDKVKSLDANMSASNLDKDESTVDNSLAELMDSKLSLYSSVFVTPKTSRRKFVPRDQVFLTGSEPTKLDNDVMVALEDSEVDSLTFPHITHWLHLVRSHSKEEQKKWRTPTVARGRQHMSTTEQRHHPQWQKHSPRGLLSSPSHLLMTPTRLF